MEKILDELRFARAYSVEKLPWFAPALFRCNIVLTKSVRHAAIDENFNIYFNPDVVQEICQHKSFDDYLAELGYLWIHQISHLIRAHGERCRELKAEPLIWNLAANLELIDSEWKGFSRPPQFKVQPPAGFDFPKGQIAEFYYQKIFDIVNCKNEGVDIKELKIDKVLNCAACDEGSGAHGEAREWELPATDKGDNLQNKTRLEMVRNSVAEAMKEQQKMGKLPGGWDRWVGQKLKPEINWKDKLKHRMRVAIQQGVGNRVDYSYMRPSRRQAVYNPIILPVLSGGVTARVVCVVDTSGSMSSGLVGQALSEVFEILKSFKIPVTIIPCDAVAYKPLKVAQAADIFKIKKLQGGGGTNMIRGIEAALKQKPAPDCVLVLTDGYTPYPPTPFKTPVVFGILKLRGNRNMKSNVPPQPPWSPSAVVLIPVDSPGLSR